MGLMAWFKRISGAAGYEHTTGTIINEGQENEQRALDVNIAGGNVGLQAGSNQIGDVAINDGADNNKKLSIDEYGAAKAQITSNGQSISPATETTQTDGSQKTQVVDNSGANIGTNTNPQITNPQPLSKDIDSIDVAKMSKGSLTVAHNAITSTATSSEIDCRGFNSVRVHVTATGTSGNTVDIALQTAPQSGGAYVDSYNENGVTQQKVTGIITPGKSFTFMGVGDYIKIVATITGTSTVTVSVMPLNL